MTKMKARHEFTVAGDTYTWVRSRKNGRVYVHRHGKPVTNFRQKRANRDNEAVAKSASEKRRTKEEVRPAEREKPPARRIYRSYMVVGYASSETTAEYRVWVHTEKPDVTQDELEEWADRLVRLYPANFTMEIFDVEMNREIDEDEMLPTDEMKKYWGFAKITKNGKPFEYYAQQEGDDFAETGAFAAGTVEGT